MRQRWAGLLAAVVGLGAGAGWAEERLPAQIGSGEESLVERVACPEADPGEDLRIKVFCRAAIRPDGRVKRNNSYCFSSDAHALPYVRAATAASEEARFVPASVDGRPVQVLMNYQFLFRLAGGACRVAAIRRSSFIPGYTGGEPAAMRYVYYLYYDPDEQSDPAPARPCC